MTRLFGVTLQAAEVREAIEAAPMFDGLDDPHLDALAAQSRTLFLPGGQVLFRRGTPSTGFYVVREGLMQLSVSNSEGMVKVVEILSPGNAFGQAVMFLHKPYPVDATALADTQLIFVPTAAVDRVLDEEPEMARIMLASVSKRLQAKIADIAMLSLQSATQRIVAYILGAVEGGTGSQATPRSVRVELPVRKQVLASRLGMTKETFSRAMRTLSDEGLITVDGAVVQIPDIAALEAYAATGSIL